MLSPDLLLSLNLPLDLSLFLQPLLWCLQACPVLFILGSVLLGNFTQPSSFGLDCPKTWVSGLVLVFVASKPMFMLLYLPYLFLLDGLPCSPGSRGPSSLQP